MTLDERVQSSLSNVVYEELKQKILTGELKPLTRLMEVSIAKQLNVSRTPVREAIKALADEELVTIEPRKGAHVSKISIKNLLDILEIRGSQEGLATALATERITPEELVTLRRLVEEYYVAASTGTRSDVIESDEKFHMYIYKCSKNEALYKQGALTQAHSKRFRYLYYEDEGNYEVQIDDHKLIVDTIASGDVDKAKEIAEGHIRILREFLMDANENGMESKIEKWKGDPAWILGKWNEHI